MAKPQILSMTGFGRGTKQDSNVAVSVELRSVNGRFLDLSFKLPREYSSLESEARKLLASVVARGRVDVSASRVVRSADMAGMRFDSALFQSYYQAGLAAATERGLADESFRREFAVSLLSRREVLDRDEPVTNLDGEKELFLAALKEACAGLVQMRAVEGGVLAKELSDRFLEIERIRREIETRAASAGKTLKTKLIERLELLAPEVRLDPARLTQEAAILADRVDVSEELSRLSSHLLQTRTVLSEPPCGRKLEFLIQELGREISTIGAKAQDAESQHLVVAAKAELEKAKEQVANIE